MLFLHFYAHSLKTKIIINHFPIGNLIPQVAIFNVETTGDMGGSLEAQPHRHNSTRLTEEDARLGRRGDFAQARAGPRLAK